MYRYRDPPEFGCALHSNGSAHYRVICVLSVVDQKVKRSRDKGPEKACSRRMQTWTHVHTHIHTPHTVYIPYHMPHTPHSTTYHHPRTWHSSPAPLLTLTPHSHHTHNSPTHPAPRNTCSSIQSLPAHLPQQQRERWPGRHCEIAADLIGGGFSYTLQPMCGKTGKNICTWKILQSNNVWQLYVRTTFHSWPNDNHTTTCNSSMCKVTYEAHMSCHR